MRTFLKQNKALLILLLGLIPFIVLIFYILGGAENVNTEEEHSLTASERGANYKLPSADHTIEIFDKMEAYERNRTAAMVPLDHTGSAEDFLRAKEFAETNDIDEEQNLPFQSDEVARNDANNLLQHIRQKGKEVKAELIGKDDARKGTGNVTQKVRGREQRAPQKTNSNSAAFSTKEIVEMEEMFDDYLALNQRNDSLVFMLKQANEKLKNQAVEVTIGFRLEKDSQSGFNQQEKTGNLIMAEVYETVTVLNGNRLKLRLLEDCLIAGIPVRKNSFVYGICQVKDERLHIQVSQVPTPNGFLPVELTIHDLDGLEGLYVPGNAARKVIKEVGGGLTPSSFLGSTADPLSYAGVRTVDKTAHTLLQRARLKKVTVKENTLVYLINPKQQL